MDPPPSILAVRNENGEFINPPSKETLPTVPTSLAGFMKHAFSTPEDAAVERTPEKRPVPSFTTPTTSPDIELIHSPVEPGKWRATWIGHASFLIQCHDVNILADPVYSNVASPVWIGPRRMQPPGIPFDDLPPIHIVILSHNHYDHCDLSTLQDLHKKFKPVFIVPEGMEKLLMNADVKHLMWWDEVMVSGVRIVCTPARHFSNRSLFGDRNKTLWCSYSLEFGDSRVFFAGDTAWHPEIFQEIGERLGPFAGSFIPIGAYKPGTMMRSVHIDPYEAVKVHVAVKSRKSIGMHWGTFNLSREPHGEANIAIEEGMEELGLPCDGFITVKIGESIGFE